MTVTGGKQLLKKIDGTPEKRLFLSIISDYDLKTGLCELVDNALDTWMKVEPKPSLKVEVTLDVERQIIRVKDNAGGVRESEVRLLIAPGASGNAPDKEVIGIFGVGGKRAGVALGDLVEIRTRFKKEKSLQIDFTKEWLGSDDWELNVFEISSIDPGTTTVDITKVRQGFTDDDVELIRQHLGETYSWFINEGCAFELNAAPVSPVTFTAWAYPPGFKPKHAAFSIEPAGQGALTVSLTAGLILDRDPEGENYGVYFYCNHRLIVKELKTRDVGYFIPSESGVPHPDASLCRVIVELQGPTDLMPWNSSKSGVNFAHPALIQLRPRVVDFGGFFSKVSRRLKSDWEGQVFPFADGEPDQVDPSDALSGKKKILPSLPSTKKPSRVEQLKTANKTLLGQRTALLGLVEAMGLVDLIGKQNLETKNRAALILLDSNLEIALKEFIVSRTDLFPPHRYNDAFILNLFSRRTNVINEVTAHAAISTTDLAKIAQYYNLRNKLIHERATTLILDSQVQDYRAVVERVLKTLFNLKFPA